MKKKNPETVTIFRTVIENGSWRTEKIRNFWKKRHLKIHFSKKKKIPHIS